MEVTHILRGNDHLENTFRHLFLFKALGAEPPRYGHFPMIVNEQGRPYSKRDGDAYVGDFREKGFLPEALFNFLALCGWSPGDDREMLRRDDLVEAFTLDRVHNAPAQFNREKLEWLNGCYIRELAEEELLPLLQEEIRGAGGVPEDFAEDWWRKLVTVQRERLKTVRDFAAKSAFFFSDAVTINWDDKKTRKAAGKEEALTVLRELKGRLEVLPEWTEAAIEAVVTEYATVSGLKMGAIAQPLRVAVTGGTVSPGIQETLFLIGRDRTLQRIDAAIAAIEERLRGA
jgi:glutamyl-tRNA synthetase